jgi:dienelactone hydrolase
MLAAYDAPAAKDAAPLVLLAQGNGETAVDQCVLGEYLASCGYVVATSPSQSRITGQPDSEGNVGLAAEDQADDLALIRNTLRSRSNILQTEIGVVGHSFGARSALLLAMRDSTVRCLVSLDGGIGTATARSSFESSRSFRPLALRIPLLHFYEELDPPMAPNWGTLDKLVASDIWIARANGLHHHHFTALGAASSRYTEVGKETRATNDVGTQYAAILDLTRAFLDAALRGDISSRDRFERGSADVHPQHLPR